MTIHSPKHPFGADESLEDLISRVRGINLDLSSDDEREQAILACKIIVTETIKRWDVVRAAEQEVKTKLTYAQLRTHINDVLDLTDAGNEVSYWERIWRAVCGR